MKINLIPQSEESVSIRSDINRVLIISAVTIFIAAFLMGVRFLIDFTRYSIFLNKEKSVAIEEESFKDIKDSYEKYKEHPAISIFNNHVYISKFLKKMSSIKNPYVVVNSIRVDKDLKASLNTTISGNYLEISRYLRFLQKENFTSPKIKSVSIEGESIKVEFEFTIPRDMVLNG